MTPHPTTKALLFDLGNVLVDVDFGRAFAAWAPYSALSAHDLGQRFTCDAHYQRHERGEIPADAYFAHLADTLELRATRAQIELGWNAVFTGEITRTRELVESLRGVLPCYAFSNTNATHMARWSTLFPAVTRAFEQIFASHLLGLRKPDRAAFDRVCALIGEPAPAIRFFDDLPENVLAAQDAGLQGVLVRSPADVETSLQEFLAV